MAEPRRLQFTTLDNDKESTNSEKPVCTARFVLSLKESTDETCSEFSYTELLKKQSVKNGVRIRKENKSPSEEDGDQEKNDLSGPFGDEDDPDEVAAIARLFEEKYGPKPGEKKKKKPMMEVIDLGEGYDENDPFIDNSEAYDELVPSTLTTRLGGFYINSGKLEFRELSDDSMDAFQRSNPLKKKRKKQVIASDSDSDKEVKPIESNKVVVKVKKRKIKDGVEGEEKKRKKKKLMNGEGGEKSFKKPKKPEEREKLKKKKFSPTVGELLKQQTESTATPTSVFNDLNSDSQESNDSSQDGKSDKMCVSVDSVPTNSKEDSNSREAGETKAVDPTQIPKLPSGIPQHLSDTIEKLKEAAKHSQDGKCKFFSNEVNSMLLKVELHCRQLPCGHRTTIYAHLASFLPCGKETLQKRAKKLRINQQDDVVREPLQKLRDAVNAVMPSIQEKHDAEYQKWSLQKKEAEAAEGNKEGEKDKEKEEKEKNNSDDSDEEKGPEATGGKKRVNGPRKKFEWTENLRVLLCEVARCKMKLCELAKNKTETNEEYLKSFLENEVKPLWPKGWMQTRMLFKETRSVHSSWTNPQKPKKTVIITKSLPGSVPNTPSNSPATSKLGTSTGSGVSDATPNRPRDVSSVLLPSTSTSSSVLDLSSGRTLSNNTTPTPAAPVHKKTGLITSGTPTSTPPLFATSPGLSLLADSAASARSLDMPPERSWDHVVSDILKSSFIPSPSSRDTDKSAISPDPKVKATGAGPGQDQGDGAGGAGFLAQFQKYASEVFAQKLKEPDTGNKSSSTSPQKQHHLQQQQQQRANLTQQQKQLVQKIQMAASQRQDKSSPSPAHQGLQSASTKSNPNQYSLTPQQKAAVSAHPSLTPQQKAAVSARSSLTPQQKAAMSVATSITPQQKAAMSVATSITPQQKAAMSVATSITPQQKAAMSAHPSLTPQQKAALQSAVSSHSQQTKPQGITLGQQTSATVALQRSLLNEEVYRQLIEADSSKLLSQATKSPSASSTTLPNSSVAGHKKSNAKVIPVTVSSTKNAQSKTLTKVINVGASNGGPRKVITVHSKSPVSSQGTSKPVTTIQISPTSQSSSQRSQARGQGSITTGQVGGQQNYSNSSSGQGSNLQSSSDFLQSLFGQAREQSTIHSPTGQVSRTSPQQQVKVSMATVSQKNKQQPAQTRSPQSPKIWSMGSIVSNVGSQHSSVASIPAYSPITTLPKPVPGYQSVGLSGLTKDMGVQQALRQDPSYLAGRHNSYSNVPTSPLTGQQQNPLANQNPPHQSTGMLHTVPPYPPARQHLSSLPYGQYTDKSRTPHGY
ncbi:Ubinuclein-2 [Mizuhopecten yessoensis]|uniref:Ubinuclein-2 n=1 Tax=Mizuhopecten yessoensis TaxID=6573 RepID=A0A210QR41_MIZYE|nr:Ubinuclein-2 [Mizuhopecten yessoensis]